MNMKKMKPETVPEMPKEAAKEMSDFAQKSVDQAQAAFEKASEVAHGNVQAFDAVAGAFKARTLDLQMKTIEIAQANVNATFAFFRKALAAKDPGALFALNQEFARDQFAALSKQASELNEISLLLAKETSQPVQDGVMKAFGDFARSIAA
jgi:phasin family protein